MHKLISIQYAGIRKDSELKKVVPFVLVNVYIYGSLFVKSVSLDLESSIKDNKQKENKENENTEENEGLKSRVVDITFPDNSPRMKDGLVATFNTGFRKYWVFDFETKIVKACTLIDNELKNCIIGEEKIPDFFSSFYANRIEFDDKSKTGSIQFNNKGRGDRQIALIYNIKLELGEKNENPKISFSTFFDPLLNSITIANSTIYIIYDNSYQMYTTKDLKKDIQKNKKFSKKYFFSEDEKDTEQDF